MDRDGGDDDENEEEEEILNDRILSRLIRIYGESHECVKQFGQGNDTSNLFGNLNMNLNMNPLNLQNKFLSLTGNNQADQDGNVKGQNQDAN